jgi:hypothetical protein
MVTLASMRWRSIRPAMKTLCSSRIGANDKRVDCSALERRFASVEARRGDFVAVTITHEHLASRVPEQLEGGFQGDARHAIFVAENAT